MTPQEACSSRRDDTPGMWGALTRRRTDHDLQGELARRLVLAEDEPPHGHARGAGAAQRSRGTENQSTQINRRSEPHDRGAGKLDLLQDALTETEWIAELSRR